MIDLIFLGLDVLLLLLFWVYILKKTILDHFRDKLFDLREESRSYFLENSSLEHQDYQKLRNLLNHYIFYMEDFNFLKFCLHQHFLKKNPDVKEFLTKEVENTFQKENKEVKDFCEKARAKANLVLFSYMLCSSLFLLTLMIVFSAIIFIWCIAKVFVTQVSIKTNGLINSCMDIIELALYQAKVTINQTGDALKQSQFRINFAS